MEELIEQFFNFLSRSIIQDKTPPRKNTLIYHYPPRKVDVSNKKEERNMSRRQTKGEISRKRTSAMASARARAWLRHKYVQDLVQLKARAEISRGEISEISEIKRPPPPPDKSEIEKGTTMAKLAEIEAKRMRAELAEIEEVMEISEIEAVSEIEEIEEISEIEEIEEISELSEIERQAEISQLQRQVAEISLRLNILGKG